jgi:hypothetical protein
MRNYLSILLLIIGSNTYGQYYPVANTLGQPATMLYIKAIKDAASGQALNVTRLVSADNICLRLQANCHYANTSYLRVWDSLIVVMPVLGDTAHATALQMDMKRLVVGTATGTVTYFRDSIRGDGSGYVNTNYAMPTGNFQYHFSTYINTAAPKPAGTTLPFDMGGSNTSTGFNAAWCIRGGIATVGIVNSRIQIYEATIGVGYSESIASNGMWVNTSLAGTNNRIFMKDGVAIDTRTRGGSASYTIGDLLLFRTLTTGTVGSTRATRGVTAGVAITSIQAVSLTNAFINSK